MYVSMCSAEMQDGIESLVVASDESEPSWLEPELELKDFQLGSARLVTFFLSARNRKSAENEPIFFYHFRLCS